MTRNVMLAFISLVNPRSIESPVEYSDLMGEPYTAVQTNEAPVVYMQRLLKENQLDSLFLIASGKVRTENVPEGSEFGDVTHLEFFEKRILRLYPALEGHFLSIDYDDATDHLETSLHDVTQVAKRIFSYIQQYPDDHIVVHADMTGGMRHVSMMMLSVMQMLKYRGVEIGEVIYADPFHHQVYPATPIQRMFDLINGADEFVKFGSVRGIREYFDGLPHNGQDDSPELRELLQAMGRFSDAIQICRTGLILEEIQNLGKRLEAFHAHEPKTQSFSALCFLAIAYISSRFARISSNIHMATNPLTLRGKSNARHRGGFARPSTEHVDYSKMPLQIARAGF